MNDRSWVAQASHDAEEHRAIGARLRQARKAAGLLQSEVSDALGLGRVSLSGMERGSRKVTAPELAQLACLYGCSVDWLLGTEDEVSDEDALRRAVGALSPADQEQVLRYARFLAAEQGVSLCGPGEVESYSSARPPAKIGPGRGPASIAPVDEARGLAAFHGGTR